jgi:hypothetical protein
MTRLRRLFLASLLAAWACIVLACSGGGSPTKSAEEDAKRNGDIAYDILEERRRGDGKVFLYILVDEKASTADVMKLAGRLWQRDDIDTLNVFDARAAYDSAKWEERKGRDNPAYPQKEMDRHWLVQGVAKGEGGDKEIRWIAKGRDPSAEPPKEKPKR